jgi:hypothetical protein
MVALLTNHQENDSMQDSPTARVIGRTRSWRDLRGQG